MKKIDKMNKAEILNTLNKAAIVQQKLLKKIAGKPITTCYLLINKEHKTVEFMASTEREINLYAGENRLNINDYGIFAIKPDTNVDNLFEKLSNIKPIRPIERDEIPEYISTPEREGSIIDSVNDLIKKYRSK